MIVLTSGHTFVGYWTSELAHEQFMYGDRPIQAVVGRGHGAKWTITSLDELCDLLDTGRVVFVEATFVTDRNARFEDACNEGARKVRELRKPESGIVFDIAVDITGSRHAVQPV